jgi:3-oxoacyl-[acyl-carrier protein] reductase
MATQAVQKSVMTAQVPKVALITGSGTGVGAATALMFAQRGWRVVINYSRSESEARQSQHACEQAGAETLLFRADIAQDADCQALTEAAVQRWGRIDALVNNAGVTSFAGPSNWDAQDAETFQRILGVNTVGAFQMIRACAPQLRESRGAIVNVSSVAGSLGIGSSVAYVASKGAINALTLHLARAMAPEVRVNAVCPGLITTRWFLDGVGQEQYEKIKMANEQATPLGQASSPEDVAEAIVWLITSARTMTGELLQLDAGMHLGSSQIRR